MWVEKKPFGRCFELYSSNIRAIISPELGMSLVSFTLGGIQILDTSRINSFLLNRKGLGPLILPHFNMNGPMPEIETEELKEIFPHIENLEKLGIKHPFQHGIGRYVSWYAEETEDSITGFLTGEMEYFGYKLKDLAGCDFAARVSFRISPDGLIIAFNVTGERAVATGIHYYYDLVNRETAKLYYIDKDGMPVTINFDKSYDNIIMPASKFGDYSNISLRTENYRLDTVLRVKGKPEECFERFVLFSPAGETFVCIEPLSEKLHNEGAIMLKPMFLE